MHLQPAFPAEIEHAIFVLAAADARPSELLPLLLTGKRFNLWLRDSVYRTIIMGGCDIEYAKVHRAFMNAALRPEPAISSIFNAVRRVVIHDIHPADCQAAKASVALCSKLEVFSVLGGPLDIIQLFSEVWAACGAASLVKVVYTCCCSCQGFEWADAPPDEVRCRSGAFPTTFAPEKASSTEEADNNAVTDVLAAVLHLPSLRRLVCDISTIRRALEGPNGSPGNAFQVSMLTHLDICDLDPPANFDDLVLPLLTTRFTCLTHVTVTSRNNGPSRGVQWACVRSILRSCTHLRALALRPHSGVLSSPTIHTELNDARVVVVPSTQWMGWIKGWSSAEAGCWEKVELFLNFKALGVKGCE
uniref:F-box domain-containing protein n=1 Tax=Mycena chlorophos TaxID=658473 RepID=A0ABQ0LCU1_MYCCL|nr:predicted protein [Mycena chlorophos]